MINGNFGRQKSFLVFRYCTGKSARRKVGGSVSPLEHFSPSVYLTEIKVNCRYSFLLRDIRFWKKYVPNNDVRKRKKITKRRPLGSRSVLPTYLGVDIA